MQTSVHQLTFNYVEENTYILVDEATKEAAIIDCGCMNEAEEQRLVQTIQKLGVTPRLLLFTHLHFDHCWGAAFAAEQYGLTPMAHDIEIQKMPPLVEQLLAFGFPNTEVRPQPSYASLHEGDEIKLGATTLKVLLVPGHTPGHIAFYEPVDGSLFAGDVLFVGGDIGRTDLPGGSFSTLIKSIKEELLPLPLTTKVYSGHGPSFDMDSVHKYNPYIQ